MITQERVKELFDYVDGSLVRKIGVNGASAGKIAGTKSSSGYLIVSVDRKRLLIHRLIFLYHRGYMPKRIDHINGDCYDNRIENLRECTQAQNCMNKKGYTNRTSKFKGIHFDKTNKKWIAQIQVNGNKKYIGSFASELLAKHAYNVEAIKNYGEFYRP